MRDRGVRVGKAYVAPGLGTGSPQRDMSTLLVRRVTRFLRASLTLVLLDFLSEDVYAHLEHLEMERRPPVINRTSSSRAGELQEAHPAGQMIGIGLRA